MQRHMTRLACLLILIGHWNARVSAAEIVEPARLEA